MANKKPRIVIFTEEFEKRYLVEDIIFGTKNLESFLETSKDRDRVILKGVNSCYKNKKGIYNPKDHKRSIQSINTNNIDFVYGPEDLIYTKNNLTSHKKISVLWGMQGLHHDLIGEIKVPGKYTPDFNKSDLEKDRQRKELELALYLGKQLNRNFIPFYNPRADSENAEEEFEGLFKETGIEIQKINQILINNKLKGHSTGHSVYLGESSKNYER